MPYLEGSGERERAAVTLGALHYGGLAGCHKISAGLRAATQPQSWAAGRVVQPREHVLHRDGVPKNEEYEGGVQQGRHGRGAEAVSIRVM